MVKDRRLKIRQKYPTLLKLYYNYILNFREQFNFTNLIQWGSNEISQIKAVREIHIQRTEG